MGLSILKDILYSPLIDEVVFSLGTVNLSPEKFTYLFPQIKNVSHEWQQEIHK